MPRRSKAWEVGDHHVMASDEQSAQLEHGAPVHAETVDQDDVAGVFVSWPSRPALEARPAVVEPPRQSCDHRHGPDQPSKDPPAGRDRVTTFVCVTGHARGGLRGEGVIASSTDRPSRTSVPSSKSRPMNVKPPAGVRASSEVGMTIVG